jgi:hypothetical protein
MMASAGSHLNRPEILAEPTRNDGSIWTWSLPSFGFVVGPRTA